MTSYEADGSPGPDDKVEDSKKISFRFCRECSNMLYPKEDRISNTLMFACRTCQFSEPAATSCIWRNSLKEDVQETAGNVDDVADDPTVGTSSSDDDLEEDMEDIQRHMFEDDDIIPEFCTYCGQEILCPICERPSDGYMALEVDDPEQSNPSAEPDQRIEQERLERERGSSAA